MKKYCLLLPIFCGSLLHAQWNFVTPLKQLGEITHLETTPNGRLYIMDQYRDYIASTEDGEVWKKNYQGSDFRDLQFLDNDQGFILKDNRLLVSSNRFLPGSINEYSFNHPTGLALHFLNEDIGFISCTSGGVRKTLDGGQTFTSISTTSTTENLNDIFFIDEHIGFVCGNQGNIYKTENQGDSWTIVANHTTQFKKIYFIDSQIGFAIGSARLFKTNDQGQSWELVLSNSDNPNFYGVNDVKYYQNKILVSTDSGRIFSSSDNGENWSEHSVFTSGTTKCLGIGELDGKILVGVSGNISGVKIFQSTDLNNWTVFEDSVRPTALQDVSFSDENRGVAVGVFDPARHANGSGILTTTDGGLTWEDTSWNTNTNSFKAVDMSSNGHGIVVGHSSNSNYSYTYDYGQNWYALNTQPFTSLSDVYLKANGDFIVGTDPGGGVNDGLILKTSSGWTQFDEMKQIVKIEFYTDELGFAGSKYGDLWKTIDGGNSWTELTNFPTNNEITRIDILDPNTILVASNGFYLSEDGGITWNATSYPYPFEFHYFDNLNGFGFDDEGLLKTSDGGDTWELILPQSELWGAGDSKKKYYFEDKIISIGNNSDISILNIPNQMAVSEVSTSPRLLVVPNPVGAYLGFSSSKVDLSNVQIYNLLGQIQKVSLSNNQVNVSSLSPGIYFIKVNFEGKRISKRFIKK